MSRYLPQPRISARDKASGLPAEGGHEDPAKPAPRDPADVNDDLHPFPSNRKPSLGTRRQEQWSPGPPTFQGSLEIRFIPPNTTLP